MKTKKSQAGIGGIANILLVCANFLFGFLVIYFLIIILAPFFGGVALPFSRLLPFAYWAGYYFVARYFLKHMKDKIKLKDYQYWLIALYHSSLVLGIPFPYNYMAFILMFIFTIKGIKREIDSWSIIPVEGA